MKFSILLLLVSLLWATVIGSPTQSPVIRNSKNEATSKFHIHSLGKRVDGTRLEEARNLHQLVVQPDGSFVSTPVHRDHVGKILASSDEFTWLYGAINTTATYFTGVTVGSAHQLFTVIVDTGSSAMAIPAKGCKEYNSIQPLVETDKKCNYVGNLYDRKKSKDSHTLPFNDATCSINFNGQCGFALTYGDGSFLFGSQIQDDFQLGQLHGNMKFGQVEGESPSFAESSEIDGIMGMAYHILDPLNGDVAFEQLVAAGEVDNIFSMCLGYSGGVMILGGYDDQYNAGPIQWTPIISETYYVVNVTDVQVGGMTLGLPASTYNQSIVDSGTTLFVLQTTAFLQLVNMISNQTCSKPNMAPLCVPNPQNQGLPVYAGAFTAPVADIMKFPNISVVFQGTGPISITPLDYFLLMDGAWNFGIAPVDGLGTILGDTFMGAYNTIFDRANKRVGFAPVANCTSTMASITRGAGNGQTTMLHTKAKHPLEITVNYPDGRPASGLVVDFEFTKGSGSFTHPRILTDKQGKGSTEVTVSSGGTNTIRAKLLDTSQHVEFNVHGQLLNTVGIVLIVVIGFVCIVACIGVGYLVWRKTVKKHHHHHTNYAPIGDESVLGMNEHPTGL